ncbi:PE-PPE domain-containing protein [Arthrobacter sp. ISL-30]|uniref:PE-PPE domain-containing protein n=1 Tax=Arthrobacter sp. ISL-30 TaxID=2819109 RepID=UPI001BEB6B46|nr:PE-PPE domain-containing protein [Arthrobacter sp. ISL-30]MBT2512394.1 hypothetical protein [Arthrobacter sp. ISL-30]
MTEPATPGPGSRETPLPVPPAQDGMLAVRGGVGGIRFQFEELVLGAAEFDRLVEDLNAFEHEERAIWDQLYFSQRSVRTFEASVSCNAALDAIQASWQSVARVRNELHRMAADIRSSHRDYEAAEAWADFGLRSAVGELPWLELPGGSTAMRFAVRDSTEPLVSGLCLLLGAGQGALGFTMAALSMSQVAGQGTSRNALVGSTVRTIVESPFGEHLHPRPVTVHGGKATVEDVDASPAGLLRRLHHLGETSEGEIEVLQLDNQAQTSWVVLIPGTQTSVPTGGSNPFDEAGIADAMGYGSKNTGAAIRQALHEIGVDPGEQIAVVGYSQGGIHAMNLAQDKAFLAEFDLRFVLTAGSPVGGTTPGPGISSLHLEHEHDLVPGLDGLPNLDHKDRVTVTMSNPLSLPSVDQFGLGPGHKLPNYLEGAEAAHASADPSLGASTAALAAVTGAGGAASVTRVRLEREPKPGRPRGSGVITAPGRHADVRIAGGR